MQIGAIKHNACQKLYTDVIHIIQHIYLKECFILSENLISVIRYIFQAIRMINNVDRLSFRYADSKECLESPNLFILRILYCFVE